MIHPNHSCSESRFAGSSDSRIAVPANRCMFFFFFPFFSWKGQNGLTGRAQGKKCFCISLGVLATDWGMWIVGGHLLGDTDPLCTAATAIERATEKNKRLNVFGMCGKFFLQMHRLSCRQRIQVVVCSRPPFFMPTNILTTMVSAVTMPNESFDHVTQNPCVFCPLLWNLL